MFNKFEIIEIQKEKKRTIIEHTKNVRKDFYKDNIGFCGIVREEMEKCIEPNKREFLLSLPYTLLESYRICIEDFIIFMEKFEICFRVYRNNINFTNCVFCFNI